MSDGAAGRTEAGATDGDGAAAADAAARDARDQQVLRLGAAGFGRAEIAAALRMCPEALDQREAEDDGLATALRGAAGLAQAWWEAQAREACAAGRFSLAAWTREMRRRFGESGPGWDRGVGAAKVGRTGLRGPGVRTIYRVPCNGKEKLNPDGTCPCGALHDDAYWRAEDAAWRAESPEHAAWGAGEEIDDEDAEDETNAGEESRDDEQFRGRP